VSLRNVASVLMVTAICLTLPSLASGQGAAAAAAPGEMSYGVKAGINISSLKVDFGDASVTGDGRAGLLIGPWVARDFNPRFGIQAEGLFTVKGSEFNAEDLGFGEDSSFSLSYIEIPVLARANFPVAPAIVRFLAGPTFAFNVNESVKVGGVKLDADQVPLKAFEMGFAIAGAVEFRKFIVDARYTWGLTDINDSSDIEDADTTVKNGTFSISFGYRFK
jgi:outer membrane protein with beta-barrel domain